MKIEFEKNEFWWGGIVHRGVEMPINANQHAVIDFGDINTPNQSTNLLLSSKGRYLYSQEPYTATFNNGTVEIDREITYRDGYANLRGAYLAAMRAYFPFENCLPDQHFFTMPQYNTWIELMYEQNQTDIIKYAEQIIENDFPTGILMIDEGWAEDYGRYEFRKGAFPDAKGMVEELKQMGFRVMLWMTPYISPDSAAFREIEPLGYLIKDHTGETAIRRWWNGYSAVLDLTNQNTCNWFYHKLKGIMSTYGIDGFKFDGGDPNMYRDTDRIAVPMSSWEQMKKYGEVGLRFSFNEFRAGWGLGGKPLVMRLSDKNHSWDENGLNMLLPNSLIQGLMGYAYHCPDMIGGGEYQNFKENSCKMDRELIVRYAQAAAFCPMMQFSAAPWRILDKEQLDIVRTAAKLHVRMGKIILKLAEEASKTGEPIMRSMEYMYPDNGYERINDQFMLGDRILVAPVCKKGVTKRNVCLPEGTWLTEDRIVYRGGRTIEMECPMDKIIWLERKEE